MSGFRDALNLLGEHVGLACVVVLAALGHFLTEPIRWWFVFVRRVGGRFNTVLNVFNTTALMSYSLPFKMGLPVRHILLKKTLTESHYFIGSALLLDTAFTYVIWIGISGIAFVATGFGRGVDVNWSTALTVAAAVMLLASVVGVFRFRGSKLGSRTRAALMQLRSRVGRKDVALAFVTIVMDLALQGLKHWAILNILGVSVSIWTGIAISTLSITAGFVSFMPLGLGAYDAVVVALAALVAVGGQPLWMIPIVSRAVNVAIAALLGSIGAARLGVKLRGGEIMRDARSLK